MKTIHHVCEVDAKPGAVWAALTSERGLASWWSTKVSAAQAAVGSVVHFTFRGDFNPDMKIEELDANKKLVWRCVGGHDKWAGGAFKFELEPIDDKRTRLRFWQFYAVELADDYYGTYNFNWGYYLESLSKYCATGKGTPYAA